MARTDRWGGCLLALALALGAGCKASSSAAKTVPATNSGATAHAAGDPRSEAREAADERSLEQRAEAHAHYGAAVLHEMNNEPSAALEDFTAAAMADLDNEDLVLEVSRRLLQRNQPEPALALLTNATARATASGDVYAQLGFVQGLLGKADLAVESDKTAIKKSPRSLAGYRNLFAIYLQGKQYEEAHKVLDLALRLPDPTPEFLVDLGELYLAFGRQSATRQEESRTDALAALNRAVALKPTDPDVRLKMADGFNVLGQPDKASPIYLDLLREYPDAPLVRTGVRAKLIEIYVRGQDRTAATAQLEALVRDQPSNPQAYYVLGNLAYDDRKMAKSVDYFTKAILFSPDFEQAYYDLARAQIGANDGKAAVETLEKSRTKFGDNFAVEYLMGIALRIEKKYAEALKCFTTAEVIAQATDKRRLDEFFYFQLASTYERKGDIEPAVKYFEKTLELAPNFDEALNYLGYMWAERGENLERARELIEKAVKLQPKNGAFLDSMAWVLFKLGQPQEALRYQLQSVELTEEPDPALFDHLGDIYAALNQMEKAREAWQKSVKLEPNEKIQKKIDQPPPR